jgi:hypothetical protein
MSKFSELEANAPATLGAVVEAVTRLSTLGEAQILELVSAGKIKDLFPFRPNLADVLPSDTMAESELEEASASPLSRKRRAALIKASMPSGSSRSLKPVAPPARHTAKKADSKR